MTGSASLLLLTTAGITLLLAPALALFFGGRPDARRRRGIAVAIPASMALVAACWMLLGSEPDVALYQGAIAAAAATVILAIGLRYGSVRGVSVFVAAWLVLVVVPVGFSVFDVRNGLLVVAFGTIDYGGASALALCVGCAAIALPLAAHGRVAPELIHRPPLSLLLSAVAALAGLQALSVGAELVIDETTLVVALNGLWAAAAGLAGWMLAQLANVHRTTGAGAIAGLIAGSVSVLPAAPWLDSTSSVAIGLTAGMLGHVTAVAARRGHAGIWATPIAVLYVPAAVGFFGVGFLAHGSGMVYSGHLTLVTAELTGLLVVTAYALLVSAVIAFAVERALGFRAR
jgi:ammonium transporter, Amt family